MEGMMSLFIVVLIIITITMLVRWRKRKYHQRQNIKQHNEMATDTFVNTIFVAFVDKNDLDQCVNTLMSLFLKASFPQRVFVGVLTEYDPAILRQKYICKCKSVGAINYINNIRITQRKVLDEHKFIYEEMFRNEKYYMIIPTYARMTQSWDNKAISQHRKVGPMGILTTIPPLFNIVTEICEEDKMRLTKKVGNKFQSYAVDDDSKIIESDYCHNELMFSLSHVHRALLTQPYDPEDVDFYTKLYHGYKFFYPKTNLCYMS